MTNETALLLFGAFLVVWLVTSTISAVVQLVTKRRQYFRPPWWAVLVLVIVGSMKLVPHWWHKDFGTALLSIVMFIVLGLYAFFVGLGVRFRPFGQFFWFEGSAPRQLELGQDARAKRPASVLDRVMERPPKRGNAEDDQKPWSPFSDKQNPVVSNILAVITFPIVIAFAVMCGYAASQMLPAGNEFERLVVIVGSVVAFIAGIFIFSVAAAGLARLLGWPESKAGAVGAILVVDFVALMLVLAVWSTR